MPVVSGYNWWENSKSPISFVISISPGDFCRCGHIFFPTNVAIAAMVTNPTYPQQPNPVWFLFLFQSQLSNLPVLPVLIVAPYKQPHRSVAKSCNYLF